MGSTISIKLHGLEAVRIPKRTVAFQDREGSLEAFWISRSPITVAQFAEFLGQIVEPWSNMGEYVWYNPNNPTVPLSWQSGRWAFETKRAHEPVTGVNIAGALAYATWKRGSLPSLAQWEAVLAGEPGPASLEQLEALANVGGCREGPTPVNRFPESQQGLLDLWGNVGLWCLPEGWDGDPLRLRLESFPVVGNAWNKPPRLDLGRPYYRWGRTGAVAVGFRCVWPDCLEEV